MAKLSQEEIIARLNEIFSFVLDTDVSLSRETTASDVEGWDSLTHVTLIGEVEEEFGFKFMMREIVGLKNVGELIDIIAARAIK